jgi:hypothetical protein
MSAGVIFMQWESYVGRTAAQAFFSERPLTFNTRQERLHQLHPGGRLWLVSRCPDDGQYYFVAALVVAQMTRNPPGSEKATQFGEYAIVADRSQSHDLGRRFPAEALLRAFAFETGRPIKYGASIGQSLQTLRLLDTSDERVLNAACAGPTARPPDRTPDGGVWRGTASGIPPGCRRDGASSSGRRCAPWGGRHLDQ